MWPFSVKNEWSDKMAKAKNVYPRTRPVWDFDCYTYRREIDDKFAKLIISANLRDDADEVIACLNESPRFRKHLCTAAEREVEEKRRALADAEEAARKACRIAE